MPAFRTSLRVTSLVLEGMAVLTTATLSLRIILGLIARRKKTRALSSVPGPARKSLLTGNLPDFYDVNGFAFCQSLAQYGGVAKLHGLFGDVALVISDPRALSHVLVKEPYLYPAIDISGKIDVQRYFFGPGLLASNGTVHKEQRKLLNPVFTASHVKRLAPLVHKISIELRDAIMKKVQRAERAVEIDVAEWLGCASLEMISQAGFGHTFHALQGQGGEYLRGVKELAPLANDLAPFLVLTIMSGASSLPPRLLKPIGRFAAIFIPSLRKLMSTVDMLYEETRRIWETRKTERRASGEVEENVELLSALLGASGEGRVSDDVLCSQAETLVFAGTETTSTALCRILHLLALDLPIQDRLRSEINAIKDLEFQYDRITSLPFLDSIIKETLRVYAPLPFRNRRSTKDSVLSLADGNSLHVPADTEIITDLHGLNVDTRVWGADAGVWRPDRWLEPLPESVIRAKIPSVLPNIMSFLGGPKACIGYNLSIVEMKTILFVLLSTFSFHVPEGDEIEWRFGPIVTPSVKGEKGLNPKMPLKVRILAEKAQ